MTAYEINKRIEEILLDVNEETGEFTGDIEELDRLMLAREEKIEGCLLFGKDQLSKADAVDAEIKKLMSRKKAYVSAANRAYDYARFCLNGETFETPRVQVKYSKAESTQTDAEFVTWAIEAERDDLLSYGSPTPNKTAIKRALKDGEDIPHAWLESGKMQVK